jgi:hypothetical protein
LDAAHIDRGYESFEEMLSRLGANIQRKKDGELKDRGLKIQSV